MTVQIAVRLDEELVAFVDEVVADGGAASRAQVVARALERERRRRIAARDAAIYAAGSDAEDDLDALARYARRTPLTDLD
jgi:Arc/MetJ-type ribon-helix-helix transcriptional regulator